MRVLRLQPAVGVRAHVGPLRDRPAAPCPWYRSRRSWSGWSIPGQGRDRGGDHVAALLATEPLRDRGHVRCGRVPPRRQVDDQREQLGRRVPVGSNPSRCAFSIASTFWRVLSMTTSSDGPTAARSSRYHVASRPAIALSAHWSNRRPAYSGRFVASTRRLPDEGLRQLPQHRVGQTLLAGEVVVDLRLVALGGRGDAVQARTCDPVLGELRRGVPVIIFPRVSAEHIRHPAWAGHLDARCGPRASTSCTASPSFPSTGPVRRRPGASAPVGCDPRADLSGDL